MPLDGKHVVYISENCQLHVHDHRCVGVLARTSELSTEHQVLGLAQSLGALGLGYGQLGGVKTLALGGRSSLGLDAVELSPAAGRSEG